MEFTEDFIKENELTDTQIAAITSHSENYIAGLKKDWDGVANTNAEKILSGAAAKIYENTKIQRQDAEKMGDYITRVQAESFSAKEADYTAKMAELEKKMKASGSDELKTEYETLKDKFSELQKKEASFDELIGSGIKEKYEKLSESNNSLNLEVSFNSVKPNFPETVNPYEAKAKWDSFKSEVLDKYNVKFSEGEAIAIDKENEHKIVKLKDLVGKDTELASLLEGRKQEGPNGNPVSVGKVDGVPFDVPVSARTDAKARAEAIRVYLAKEGVSNTDSKYSKLFAEYNDKIKGQQTA